MTTGIRIPCPYCPDGFVTTGDRHARTKQDVCENCGGEGVADARTGETPETSAPPLVEGSVRRVEVVETDEPPAVHEFHINEPGGPNIVVEGGTWFIHSREFAAYKAWAERRITALTAPVPAQAVGARDALTPFAASAQSLAEHPPTGLVKGNLCVACKNEGKGTRWRYLPINASVGDLDEALAAFTASAPVEAPDDDTDRCEACGIAFRDGDRVLDDHNNGGTLHASCCGPERESYTDADGEPLKGEDPIPEGYVWKGETPAPVEAGGGEALVSALRLADWSNVSIGNKALIQAAINALAAPRTAPAGGVGGVPADWRAQAADEVEGIASLWEGDGRSYAMTVAAILRAEEPTELQPADADTKRVVARAWERFKAGTAAAAPTPARHTDDEGAQ